MAKKKKRRPTSAGRSGEGGGVVTKPTRQEVVPTVRPEPAIPGGPNRQARKDEARRQREAIRRRMARRHFLQRAGIVALAVVVVAAVGFYVALKPNPAKAAGCGSVQTISQYKADPSLDRAHISAAGEVKTPPPLSTYPSQPPTSGPHDLNPWPAGVNATAPDVYRTIHSLEHGAVIIWYAPGAAGSSAVISIGNFYRPTANGDHVIVAPYDYKAQGKFGQLPAGKKMVLVAWHHMQLCNAVNLAAAKKFVASYRVTTGQTSAAAYKGDAPEAGSPL
jgi:hypothetical protein